MSIAPAQARPDAALSAVEAAKHAYDLAVFGGASIASQGEAFGEYLAARRATETPAETLSRLKTEEDDKRASSARHSKTEADLAGRIASCRTYGNDEVAAFLEPQRRAAERCATRALDEAAAIAGVIATLTRRASFAEHTVQMARAS